MIRAFNVKIVTKLGRLESRVLARSSGAALDVVFNAFEGSEVLADLPRYASVTRAPLDPVEAKRLDPMMRGAQ